MMCSIYTCMLITLYGYVTYLNFYSVKYLFLADHFNANYRFIMSTHSKFLPRVKNHFSFHKLAVNAQEIITAQKCNIPQFNSLLNT